MPTTHPEYRTTPTEAGANVNYDCPCGCDAGFAYQRDAADQAPESCCCGRQMLVGAHASDRLHAVLETPEGYDIDRQSVSMPWGQSIEVALATPPDPEHGAEAHDHDDHHGHGH